MELWKDFRKVKEVKEVWKIGMLEHNDEKTDWIMAKNKKSESSYVKPMCWAKSKINVELLKEARGWTTQCLKSTSKVSVDDESEEERIDYAAT